MTTPNKCALPTPSELRDEIIGFSRESIDVTFFGLDGYELCLPLIVASGWQVTIHVGPQEDGTFLIYGYDSNALDFFFFSNNEKQEEKLVRFFDCMPIEEREDFGFSVICTRKELPRMIHLFGIFIQTLSFIRFLNN